MPRDASLYAWSRLFFQGVGEKDIGGGIYSLHTEKSFRNEPEIKLYLLFSDWFGIKRTVSFWFQFNRKTIIFWFDLESKQNSVWCSKSIGKLSHFGLILGPNRIQFGVTNQLENLYDFGSICNQTKFSLVFRINWKFIWLRFDITRLKKNSQCVRSIIFDLKGSGNLFLCNYS